MILTDHNLMVEGIHSVIQRFEGLLRDYPNADKELITQQLEEYYAKREELRSGVETKIGQDREFS